MSEINFFNKFFCAMKFNVKKFLGKFTVSKLRDKEFLPSILELQVLQLSSVSTDTNSLQL